MNDIPRKFIGWNNVFWGIILWLAFMYAIFMGTIFVFKTAFGIYTLQDRIDRLEYRLDHMEAE